MTLCWLRHDPVVLHVLKGLRHVFCDYPALGLPS